MSTYFLWLTSSKWQWPFFNGQFRLSNSKYFSSQTTTCKIQFDSDVKAMEIKLNGRGWFPQVTWFLHSLPLIGHNLLLVYYHFEYKGNFYKYGLYYTWVQMLLQIGPLLHLGPIITLVPSTDVCRLKQKRFLILSDVRQQEVRPLPFKYALTLPNLYFSVSFKN